MRHQHMGMACMEYCCHLNKSTLCITIMLDVGLLFWDGFNFSNLLVLHGFVPDRCASDDLALNCGPVAG
jgi:hypothetical protein